jgi:glycosyl hydrolase family 39 (putative alpha-L-iduronidase)
MARLEAVDPSPFGLNVHVAHDLIPVFAEIGIRWFRVDLNWDETEPEPERLEWSVADRIVEAAEDSGVSLLMSVAYTPEWASAPARRAGLQRDEARTLPPRDPDLFVRFLDRVLERYGTTVQAMSLWNEPDFEQFWMGSLDEYLTLWTAGLSGIRRASPAMVIGGPDSSNWRKRGIFDLLEPKPERRWMARVLERAGCRTESPLIDVFTHHQYGAGDTPAGRAAVIEDLHAFLAAHCRAVPPIWITETGLATNKRSKQAQAQHLRTMLDGMAVRASWWHKTFWYDSNGRQGDAEWGLLGPDGAPDARQPRPAFQAYAEVIKRAGGMPPVSRALALRRVDLAYRAILGREPDPGGLVTHARLAQTRSTEFVCDALLGSDEFRERARQLPLEEVVSHFLAVARGQDASPRERQSLLEAFATGRAGSLAARIIEETTPTG